LARVTAPRSESLRVGGPSGPTGSLEEEARPLLSVNNIEVIYDHVILVLKGVSLRVPEGKIIALLGAIGAG
jgi:branched-chain amino acid transport system ATP-binding protein